ncbi:uncharacterized protein LY89DRAFT_733938 [Mollisia scopiformis]|uniref:C2H2-type domain-containing protein n=1 Tax=Mollisia scopiformis TaxID=149040 RepID=A0A194X9X8_MOLSC|nr:uncharacterized protein LY89DRAFT_733938 [Mollisia scopiformis]KUJ16939.1 hypothetical protein LY89DRAFT_733938 [Mollisia scopiformis]
MKRHRRPYGCTFSNCDKTFGSKNDWKRHENSQHFQLESWRCNQEEPEGSPCIKVCYRRQTFQDHLTKDHSISDKEVVKSELESCRIGRSFQTRFWCGFCIRLIDLTKRGLESWNERFDHIDDHFMGRQGLPKQDIMEWIDIDSNKSRGGGLSLGSRSAGSPIHASILAIDVTDSINRKDAKIVYSAGNTVSRPSAQQDETALEDIPLTDSGYASAPNRNNTSNLQLMEQPRSSQKNKSTGTINKTDGEDSKTIYSAGSTVARPLAQQYIADLCSNIFGKLGKQFDSQIWSTISSALPELMKAFAIKIGYDSSTPVNQEIMYFIHKRHEEIIAQLEAMVCHPEEDDEPDSWQDGSKGMSIADKMKMWSSKAEEDHPLSERDEFFKGVKDEDEIIPEIDLAVYQQVILNSPAYEWFISSVRKELSIQCSTNQPPVMIENIRRKILEKLPTGVLSKRRALGACEVQFELRWENEKEGELPNELYTQLTQVENSLVLTGSPKVAQGLTVREYLSQTWLANGSRLLDVILEAVHDTEDTHSEILPDNTRLAAKIWGSHLFVKATGPAHFIAECGEQLAWFRAALRNSTGSFHSYTPSITGFAVDANPSLSRGLKYKGWCAIGEGLIRPIDSNLYWHDLVGSEGSIIQGFPISRRPEGYPGLELSFDKLLYYLRANEATIANEQILLQGKHLTVQLAKHTGNVFLWHPFRPWRLCTCCTSQHPWIGPIDLHVLKSCRHILSQCPEPQADAVENPDIETPMDTPRLFQNQHVVSEEENVFTLSGSEKGEHVSSTSIIKKGAYDVLENSPSHLHMDDPKCKLLVEDETQLAEGYQSMATTGSLDIYLDSDLFSTSDSSNQDDTLDIDEPAYPVLRTVLLALLTKFRGLTQYQLSPSSNAGQSVTYASGNGSGTTTGTSNNCRKRDREEEEEEDDDDDDGANKDNFKPPRKKHASEDKATQRSLACPYLKFDLVKHRSCCTKKLSRIRDVKQHLCRKHTPKRYCQCCLETNFQDAQTLQMHVGVGTCQANDPETLDGISTEKERQLTRKSNRKLCEEDQWYAIWNILFPRHPCPASPYINTSLSIEMRLFREYCNTHGPIMIREQLDSSPGLVGQEITEEQRQMHLERVIAQGINTLFEEYQRLSVSSTLPENEVSASSTHRSNDLQATQFETSTSSNADSGVVLENQISSRATQSQENIAIQGTSFEWSFPPLVAAEDTRQDTWPPPEGPPQNYEQNALYNSYPFSSEILFNGSEMSTFDEPESFNTGNTSEFLSQSNQGHNNGFQAEDGDSWMYR